MYVLLLCYLGVIIKPSKLVRPKPALSLKNPKKPKFVWDPELAKKSAHPMTVDDYADETLSLSSANHVKPASAVFNGISSVIDSMISTKTAPTKDITTVTPCITTATTTSGMLDLFSLAIIQNNAIPGHKASPPKPRIVFGSCSAMFDAQNKRYV